MIVSSDIYKLLQMPVRDPEVLEPMVAAGISEDQRTYKTAVLFALVRLALVDYRYLTKLLEVEYGV